MVNSDGSSEISNGNMPLSGQEEERQGDGDASREKKRPERELDGQWRTQQKLRPQWAGIVQEKLES